MSFINALTLYLAFINLLAFVQMGLDKHYARTRHRRIRERTLFLSAFLGGSVGGLLGMAVFRHKTRHSAFSLGFPLILAVQLGLAWFFGR